MYIKIVNLNKVYTSYTNKVIANKDINFEINKGDFVIITGPSGAGKSTLLNILGAIEKADSGHIFIDGKDIIRLDDINLTKYRREDVGFVFQHYNLIPNLTVLENIELATEISNDKFEELEILRLVGLENKKNNFPYQLSGGEQQRVAIARAISKKPKLLLCDEPTGALDFKNSKIVLKLLYDISRKYNITVIIVTHNNALKKMADINIEIYDSRVRTFEINKNIISIDEIMW